MSNSNRMTARKQAENYHRHCDEVLNTVADRISKKRQQGFDTDEQKMNFVYNIRSEADDLTRSLEAGIVDVEKAYSDVVKRITGGSPDPFFDTGNPDHHRHLMQCAMNILVDAIEKRIVALPEGDGGACIKCTFAVEGDKLLVDYKWPHLWGVEMSIPWSCDIDQAIRENKWSIAKEAIGEAIRSVEDCVSDEHVLKTLKVLPGKSESVDKMNKEDVHVDRGRKRRNRSESEFESESNEICAICLQEINECQDVAGVPACDHVFHQECMVKWARMCSGNSTCPVCRSQTSCPEKRDTI